MLNLREGFGTYIKKDILIGTGHSTKVFWIWMDCDITYVCGHLGEFCFLHDRNVFWG